MKFKDYLLNSPISIGMSYFILNYKYIKRNNITCYGLVTDSDLDNNIYISKNTRIVNSKIGSYTYIASNTKIFRTEIGKFCSIASDVIIGPGVHPTNYVSTHPIFYSNKKQCGISFAEKSFFQETKNVTIGNDVWIGTKVVILDGVSIGDGAIVAAGAIVKENVPPYAIVGGIPAKVIKFRFDDKKISKLMQLKWWDKSEEWLKANCEKMRDIDSLLKISFK